MWINNRILVSGITATLLLAGYPTVAVAADPTGVSYEGNVSETNTDSITLDDTSSTLTPIEITDVVNSGITISNSAILTVDSDSGEIYGILADNGNDGTINHSGTIDLNSTSGSAYGVLVWDGTGVNSGMLTNSGDIIVEAGSEASGIYVYDNSGTITNSGTIDISSTVSGNAAGIYVENENSGVITNTSGITSASYFGNADGIYIGSNTMDGNITNEATGTITATSTTNEASGISIGDTNEGEVNNLGTITATSTESSAYGIRVGTNDGTINNEGSIAAEGRGDTYGIYSDSNGGTIIHSGTIDASTTDDGGAYGIYTSGIYGTITTNGSINAHSLNGSTYGIYTDGDNNGQINANDSIIATTTDGDATGIYIGGNNQNLTNNGSIEAQSVNNRATGIEVSISNDGTISNIGSITSDSIASDAYGITVSSNSGTISNAGTIESSSRDSVAYGIYVNDNMGTITNSGTITAPTAVYIGSGGTFENTASGTINGDLQMGSTNVQNNGTINLVSTSNTSTVNDFTQSAGGILEIRLNSAADGVAEYSKLSANGTVTLNSGSTLNVNVQTSTDYQGLLIGQQLTDVISASTLTADASTLNVTDTSALLNFVPVVDGATLDLNVVKGVSILDATQNSGVVGAYGAASVLENYTGDDSDLNAFISSLNTLETEEEVAHAILETTPTTTTALSNMSTQFYSSMGSIVQSHQNNPRGMNSGDMVLGDKNLWVKPFGSYSKQNDKNGVSGFSAHSKGVGIGLDGEYENNQRIGLAVFYTQADADTNGVNQNTKLDIFNLIVYGNFPIIDNSTNLFYQLGMGIQQTSSTRTITAPALTAKADYNAKTLFANVKLARDTAFNNALSLSNQLFGTYVYYKNPSYSESGAGGLNLNVQGFDTTSLVLGVEESLKYSMTEGTNLIVNVAFGYDFGDTKHDVLASYYGASGTVFSTAGIDNGPWSYKTGVEVAQKLQNDLSVSMGYDLDGKGRDFKNHSVSAKVNWKF